MDQKKNHSKQEKKSIFHFPDNVVILKVTSTNFKLKSFEEQESIIDNFGKFLNSIIFPVQIICDSKIINPKEWILKEDNDNEYYDFLSNLVKSRNTAEKIFYVAFNCEHNKEIITQSIIRQIKRCGLLVEETSYEESSYIPFLKPSYVKIGDWYYNTLIVTDLPSYAENGILDELCNLDKNITLSVFIHPMDKEKSISYLSSKLARLQSNIILRDIDLDYNGEYDDEVVSAINMRNELIKNEGNFFFTSFYITIKSLSKKDLVNDTKFVQSFLRGIMIKTKEAFLRQDDGYKCSQPFGIDFLKDKASYTFTTTPLKRFFPFISSNIADDGGIFIGENLKNNSLVFLNHFKYLTASMIVLGKSGSGKSYCVKSQILKMIKQGIEVTVLDIENEFKKLGKNNNLIVKNFNHISEYKRFLINYWNNVKNNPNKPRFLVIDEFWEYMKDEEIADLIQEIIKKSRKRWLGVCAITQEIEDLLNSKYAKSLIVNSSIKILLNLEPTQGILAKKNFGLTDQEVSFLITAEEGEGILFAATNHVQFKTIVSEEQHKIITTKPNEIYVS